MDLQALKEESEGFCGWCQHGLFFHEVPEREAGECDLIYSFTLRGASLPVHGRELKHRLEGSIPNLFKLGSKESLALSDELSIAE